MVPELDGRTDLPPTWLTSVLHHVMKGAVVDVINGRLEETDATLHLRDGAGRLRTLDRMLGSVSEAEDVVQEGFLRLHRAREGGERIESPRAYLSTVVSRLSLDQLRSARVRRETYVGEWLPEPLVARADDDPAYKAEMADSLSLAFLVLLESLSPEQRAAFLLRRHLAPRGGDGQPGALFIDPEGRLIAVTSLDVAEGQIQAVSSIVDPDKLQHLGPFADLDALLRGRTWDGDQMR
jgi:RNA polymerase sigma factor (sigma-70 family)